MILIALGANLPSFAGPPAATLDEAIKDLAQHGVDPVARSRFYVTPAWPDPQDPAFVNAVMQVETALTPEALLARLHAIEARFGRERSVRNGPRVLDLDILDYNELTQVGPPTLPHPRMEQRGFVLVPLAEVAPRWRHPVSGRSVADLIADLSAADRDLPVLK